MTDPICLHCRSPLIIVLDRAWCVRPYAGGGCGAFWSGAAVERLRERVTAAAPLDLFGTEEHEAES